jgi:hypothetical protein
MSACAAFIKESRMEFANANKVYRKSGGSPNDRFCRTISKAVMDRIALVENGPVPKDG